MKCKRAPKFLIYDMYGVWLVYEGQRRKTPNLQINLLLSSQHTHPSKAWESKKKTKQRTAFSSSSIFKRKIFKKQMRGVSFNAKVAEHVRFQIKLGGEFFPKIIPKTLPRGPQSIPNKGDTNALTLKPDRCWQCC